MIIVMVISAMIMMSGGGLFFRSFSAVLFSVGVALMTSVNIVKVFMIKRAVKLSLEREIGTDGRNVARLQYFFRFLLTGAVFLAVAFITRQTGDFAAIWGGLIGALTLQIGAMSLKFMKLEAPRDEAESFAKSVEPMVESVEKEGDKFEL